MRLTWNGHSNFRLDFVSASVLIDPFFTGNPVFSGTLDAAIAGVTHCALTHGHADHTGDVMEVARDVGPHLFANYELCEFLREKGIAHPERLQPMNTGGTVSVEGVSVSLVRADHSSSQDGTPLGACNGVIVKAEGRSIWHLGDTDIFTDMALICEIHRPQIAIVPIGDRFTMGPETAALAVKRFMPGVEAVLPCHYATFPPLVQSAHGFADALKGHAVEVFVPKVGETLTI